MPLPDETKAKSARDLIARFQTSINTVSGADAPLKPRHSFGSNEGLSGPGSSPGSRPASSSGGTSPRPSLDVGLARQIAEGRATSPGTADAGRYADPNARLSPGDAKKLDEFRLDAPIATEAKQPDSGINKGSQSNGNANDSTLAVKEKQAANAPELGATEVPQKGQPAGTAAATDASSWKAGLAESTNAASSSPQAGKPMQQTSVSPSAVPKPVPAAIGTASSRSPTAASATSPTSRANKPRSPAKASPTSPTKSAHSAKSREASSSTTASNDLSKSVSRRVISPDGVSAGTPARARTAVTPSPSTSRLMQPTAASRARASTGGSSSSHPGDGSEATRYRATLTPGTSREASTSSTSGRPIYALSSASASTPRVRKASTSSASGGPVAREKALSPAQLGRLAAEETTGVHRKSASPASATASSRTRQASLASSGGPGGNSMGRSRSSLAMAREASHETPTKGAKPVHHPGSAGSRAKVAVPPASSAFPSSNSPRPASGTAAATTPRKTSSASPSSSAFSRLTRPTASSLAHSRDSPSASPSQPASSPSQQQRRSAPGLSSPKTPIPNSPTAKSTPGSSAKATVGSRMPPARAQGSPLTGVKGNPGLKVGVVMGPRKIDLKGKGKSEASAEAPQAEEQADSEKSAGTPEAPAAALDSKNEERGEQPHHNETDTDEAVPASQEDIPDIPPEAEVEHIEYSPRKRGNADLPPAGSSVPSHPDQPAEQSSAGTDLREVADRLSALNTADVGTEAGSIVAPTVSEPVESAPAAEDAQQTTQPEANGGEKVFQGFGSHRPVGKIGVPLHAAPVQVPEHTGGPDYLDQWGTRDGADRLPSPRVASPAMSAQLSGDSAQGEQKKKVPIWMRKGGGES